MTKDTKYSVHVDPCLATGGRQSLSVNSVALVSSFKSMKRDYVVLI